MDRKTYSNMIMSMSPSPLDDYRSPLDAYEDTCNVIDCNGRQEVRLYDKIPEAVHWIDELVEQNLYQMPQNAVYGWLNARKDILEAAGKGETSI